MLLNRLTPEKTREAIQNSENFYNKPLIGYIYSLLIDKDNLSKSLQQIIFPIKVVATIENNNIVYYLIEKNTGKITDRKVNIKETFFYQDYNNCKDFYIKDKARLVELIDTELKNLEFIKTTLHRAM